ncbi:MAG: serine hydrolase [Planctomycetales bacterium]|nr:serine hydrolase [Planctomycetales bacterium]
MRRRISCCATALVAMAGFVAGASQNAQAAPRVQKDIEFASVDGHSLKLDLYLPEENGAPLVVWIHGGGWRSGSKERCFVSWLTEHGYAVASVSYRLTDKAAFPAQLHDCKGAIRWLRANADKYGYRADKVAVAGSSAGGHLAALVGTTGDEKELEGSVGGNLDQSSRVSAVADYFGPTEFLLRTKNQPQKTVAKGSPVNLLLGGPADERVELARQASPVFHVTSDDPPLLIFHGAKDNTVYIGQSHRMVDAYTKAKLPVTLHVLEDASHGGTQFFTGVNQKRLVEFLDQHLKAADARESSALPRSTPESQGVSSASVTAFVKAADEQVDTMHSFMLVRHGRVVAEGWWSPEAADKPHILWSLSKSFTSTAVGLAVAEGKLDIDDKVLKFFPDDAPADPSENLQAMRVRDLLTMSAGHETETALANEPNWTRAFLAHPVLRKPGTWFRYNTPGTYMQSAIVQKVTGQTTLDYLTPRLFEPLGIKKPVWDASPQGVSIGGYGLYLCTEDIAKFGQLYLQKGMWNGKRLIPAEWIAQATSKQVDNDKATSSGNPDWREGYGFQFWQCRHGAYRGDGRDGQFCIVLPQQEAVIAITAKTGNMQRQLDLVWEHLLPAFHDKPLPEDDAAQARLKETLAGLKVGG